MLAARDETLTIAPPPLSTMTGTVNRISTNGAVTLKRCAASNAFSLVSINGRGSQPPALLTSTSMRPNSPIAAATSRSRSSVRVTSHCTDRLRRPRSRTSAAVRSMSATVRAATTTSAPASASARAVPAPMPLPAPVTTATRSVSLNWSRITAAP